MSVSVQSALAVVSTDLPENLPKPFVFTARGDAFAQAASAASFGAVVTLRATKASGGSGLVAGVGGTDVGVGGPGVAVGGTGVAVGGTDVGVGAGAQATAANNPTASKVTNTWNFVYMDMFFSCQKAERFGILKHSFDLSFVQSKKHISIISLSA